MVSFRSDERISERCDEAENIDWCNDQQRDIIAVTQCLGNRLCLLALKEL